MFKSLFDKKYKSLLVIPSTLLLLVVAQVIKSHFTHIQHCNTADKTFTEEELIRKVAGKVYEENVSCCRFSNQPMFSSESNNLLNKMFGRYHYLITLYYEKEKTTKDQQKTIQFYEQHITIDECGNEIDSYGMMISEKTYNLMTSAIKKRIIQD